MYQRLFGTVGIGSAQMKLILFTWLWFRLALLANLWRPAARSDYESLYDLIENEMQ